MIYHETLSSALSDFAEQVTRQGGVFSETEEEMFFHVSPISYSQTRELHYALATLKGKKTKKHAHCSIYRCENGRYELTVYIL